MPQDRTTGNYLVIQKYRFVLINYHPVIILSSMAEMTGIITSTKLMGACMPVTGFYSI